VNLFAESQNPNGYAVPRFISSSFLPIYRSVNGQQLPTVAALGFQISTLIAPTIFYY